MLGIARLQGEDFMGGTKQAHFSIGIEGEQQQKPLADVSRCPMLVILHIRE